uniref:Nucleoporin NUP35 n=1 Tax=Parastrongyloides trichosuri TaxID=131310 RepID=A0A0N4ZKA2_PARTI
MREENDIFMSKPPKNSINKKFSDYPDYLLNFSNGSERNDNYLMDDGEGPNNESPNFLFKNKFRFYRSPSLTTTSRPPIISINDDTPDNIESHKKERKVNINKKVTFKEDISFVKAFSTPSCKMGNEYNSCDNVDNYEEENYWVLVFGFNDNVRGEVINKLERYGKIIKITQREGCSFMHVRYSSISSSRKVIELKYFNINENMLIGVHECNDLSFLETEAEITDSILLSSSTKTAFKTPLAICKLGEQKDPVEEDTSMFNKIVQFLLY